MKNAKRLRCLVELAIGEIGRRYAPRPMGARINWAAALFTCLLAASGAQAGIEFVTPIGKCNTKVDQINDGKDLFIISDQNVRFEVWGFQMDSTKSVHVQWDDNVHGNITAKVIRTRSGPENSGRVDQTGSGCPFVGSVEVEVDTPVTFTVKRQRSLYLKVEVLGFSGEHRLQMTVKPYPKFDAKWLPSQNSTSCIVKTGQLRVLEQDTLIELALPPGHRQDTTTCNDPQLTARIFPVEMGELDIVKTFRYSVSPDLPPFLTVESPDAGPALGTSFFGASHSTDLLFKIDTLAIRAISNTSSRTFTISSPNPNRTDKLRLVVRPNLANGFAEKAVCIPSTLDVNGLTACHLKLAAPAGSEGQPITWRITTPRCFVEANSTAPYNPNSPFQVFPFLPSQREANIPMRVANDTGCGSETGIQYIFEAWVGEDLQVTAATSGPNYTKDTITVRAP